MWLDEDVLMPLLDLMQLLLLHLLLRLGNFCCGWEEFNCVSYPFTVEGWEVYSVTAVVFEGWAKIVCILAMHIPCSPVFRILIDDAFCSNRGEQCSVKII